MDLSCTTAASCLACPDGYFLSAKRCLQCGTIAHCIACDSTNSTRCKQCEDGYYVGADSTCLTCVSNCLTCDSNIFCTKAASGYYVSINDAGSYTGTVLQCESPCATCIDYTDFCLSCVSGYSLRGSVCKKNTNLVFVLILGPSKSGNSIFSDSDSPDQQVFFGIRAFNRLGGAIDFILPNLFKDGRHWRKRMRFRRINKGSLSVGMDLDAGGYSSGSDASSAFTNAVSSSSIDGASYLSSSVTAEGFTTSSGSSTSLGLVLGLAIPLSILRKNLFIQ